MCKAQGGLVAILACESGEAVDHDCEFLEDDGEGGADEDEIRVAEMMSWKSERRQVAYQFCSLCNIARCRAETVIKGLRLDSDRQCEISKTHWMIPAADGATVPNVCTCAMTS